MSNFRLIALSSLCLSLAACGGGGGGGGTAPPSENEPEISVTDGGSVGEPTPIDYYNLNSIRSEDFWNHYQVQVSAGDELFISSSLTGAIDETDYRRCTEREDYYTGIRILDAPNGALGYNERSCSPFFYHQFEEAGTYTIRLGFPGLTGTFIATLLPAGQDPVIGHLMAEGGLPDSLGQISTDGQNELAAHPVTNHYGYEGKEGETIYIKAYIDPREDATTERRCKEFSSDYDGKYAFGWSVVSSPSSDGYGLKPRFNCSHELSYTFPADGTYHFNFRSFVGGTGHFYATVTEAPM